MMLCEYKKQLSVFTEVIQLMKTRRADAHLLASVMLEAENSTAYKYYIERAIDCEGIITFCEQKLEMRT